jgi:hypothetical protein
MQKEGSFKECERSLEQARADLNASQSRFETKCAEVVEAMSNKWKKSAASKNRDVTSLTNALALAKGGEVWRGDDALLMQYVEDFLEAIMTVKEDVGAQQSAYYVAEQNLNSARSKILAGCLPEIYSPQDDSDADPVLPTSIAIDDPALQMKTAVVDPMLVQCCRLLETIVINQKLSEQKLEALDELCVRKFESLDCELSELSRFIYSSNI